MFYAQQHNAEKPKLNSYGTKNHNGIISTT